MLRDRYDSLIQTRNDFLRQANIFLGSIQGDLPQQLSLQLLRVGKRSFDGFFRLIFG